MNWWNYETKLQVIINNLAVPVSNIFYFFIPKFYQHPNSWEAMLLQRLVQTAVLHSYMFRPHQPNDELSVSPDGLLPLPLLCLVQYSVHTVYLSISSPPLMHGLNVLVCAACLCTITTQTNSKVWHRCGPLCIVYTNRICILKEESHWIWGWVYEQGRGKSVWGSKSYGDSPTINMFFAQIMYLQNR